MQTVAVCDMAYKKKKVLEDGIISYTNYDDLLKENLDVLFVSLPNYIAPEVTIAGLSNGLHVF